MMHGHDVELMLMLMLSYQLPLVLVNVPLCIVNRCCSSFLVMTVSVYNQHLFLSQPLVCGTVFHRTSLLSPLSSSSAVDLNHISSHFLIPLFSDLSLIHSDHTVTCDLGHHDKKLEFLSRNGGSGIVGIGRLLQLTVDTDS